MSGPSYSDLPVLLLPWYRENARELPWRADQNPYHVWLSEIMLQQTRVEAVKKYYYRFLKACPDIPSVAAASPEMLNKLWEGLGYYSRVRNLQSAAKDIIERFRGVFPNAYSDVRSLKGIGDYTAGAICSICFGQPVPAVDGNVLRVICRYTGDATPIENPVFRRELRDRLAAVYPAGECGAFTQALMELGATVCTPNGTPDCTRCPLRDKCLSASGQWRELPVKTPKQPRRTENLTVFLLRCGERVAVRKRPAMGLLAGLWEFPNIPGFLTPERALAETERYGLKPLELLTESDRRHIFTHIEWNMHSYSIRCAEEPDCFVWVDLKKLDGELSLPTAFRQFRDHIIFTGD